MSEKLKALRGATNLTEDSKNEIDAKTEELIGELIKQNDLAYEDMVCVVFSLTSDITAAYPAATFRNKFVSCVPLFSCLEPNIQGGMPLTIRVMILHYGKKNNPVYLHETKNLRKDLFYEHCN